YEALGELGVGIDAAVPKERPADPKRLHVVQIDLRDEDRLGIGRRADNDSAVRRGEKALPPELDAAAAVRRRLEADAIDGEHEAAVRDRVAPLYRLPRRVLPLAVLGLLLGMPTDRGRVDQELRAAQRREPCRLRIPLIPADEHAELGGAGRERPKAQVA